MQTFSIQSDGEIYQKLIKSACCLTRKVGISTKLHNRIRKSPKTNLYAKTSHIVKLLLKPKRQIGQNRVKLQNHVRMPVTSGISTFLVGNPYKPSLSTGTLGGRSFPIMVSFILWHIFYEVNLEIRQYPLRCSCRK